MIPYNPCLRTDSYKISHHLQDPSGLSFKRNYFEARGGQFGELTFFGLSYYLQEYLRHIPTHSQVDYANNRLNQHFGHNYFNSWGWHKIVDMGYIPLRIYSVSEGLTIPHSNLMFWCENTVPGFGWLPGHYEGLLMKTYYPSSVSTLCRQIKKHFISTLKEHTDLELESMEEKLPFMLHDFGYRANYSEESAMLASMAHLTCFKGTDTLIGLEGASHYYDAKMAGYSVFASEHSTMTVLGQAGEEIQFIRMLDMAPDDAIVSVVADSYNIYDFISKLVNKHKTRIKGRSGKLVIRPDSGIPEQVVVRVLDLLGKVFGYTTNSKRLKVLPPYIGVIQGDGVSYYSIRLIQDAMINSGWSPENVIFGMGGKLHTDVNRDTHQCAIKACSATINDEDVNIYKNPVDQPNKASKSGFLDLIQVEGKISTISQKPATHQHTLLRKVFENGNLFNKPKFEQIVERTNHAI